MPDEGVGKRRSRRLDELNDVFDFLEEVRLRPGMWVRSLEDLSTVLDGYRVALQVHGVAEDFDFWPDGPFSEWLWTKLGRKSSLGWAVEIEREAQKSDVDAMGLFFVLVDEYRGDVGEDRHVRPRQHILGGQQ